MTGSRLHLIAPLGFSLDEKHLRRAGLDYWDKVHAATWASFGELVETEKLTADVVHLFTGRTAERSRALWAAKFAPGDWLILGEEAKGLPDAVLGLFPDRWVRVPMIADPTARSLNLSTCAGIAVYEALRQCGAARAATSPA